LDDKDTALLGYAVHRFKDPYAAWMLRDSGFVPAKWVLPVLDSFGTIQASFRGTPQRPLRRNFPGRDIFQVLGIW